ncbi:hypothetical protein UC3_01989 [Enterococcus phoeniculicola ATCC BAA-412]|uniref:TraD/TraG TraM recognition site domain-containing protein n=2 Tax=Enterococcus phoeniculicola TaxID=154621 RepID=R3W620_9ENTE|nr:hypothetical protein UC3_01989 [Enterococcus phoeniculicola ATCC BAA-412]EOT76630.1 hypothetical protein I589_01587 [Enterococcus phoeniculicola ATCC BAA-412]
MYCFLFLVLNAICYFIDSVIPNLTTSITGDFIFSKEKFLSSLFKFNHSYFTFYFFGFLIGGYFIFRRIFQLRTNFRPLEDEFSQGSMEWANVKNLIGEYATVPVRPFSEEDYYDGKPGLPISRIPRNAKEKKSGEFRYLVETVIGNMLILAATRIGKSRYFLDPFIDTISRAKNQLDRWSFVMTATKGTEPREWYQILKSRGYNIRIYNTVNQFYSDPFPILKVFFTYYKHYYQFKKKGEQQLTEKEQQKYLIKAEMQLANAENMLRRAAQSYFLEVNQGKDGGFWTKACRNLFTSLALAVADQVLKEGEEEIKVNPYTIYDIANEMIAIKITKESYEYLKEGAKNKKELDRLLKKYEGSSILDVYFQELPKTNPARKYYQAILASAPAKTTLGNVLTHFDGDLESFLQSANAKMTSYDDGYNLEDIGFDKEKPTAVFIIFSDTDELNNRLGMLILDQIYQILKNKADLQEDPSQAHCVRPVLTIYEEGGNLGLPVPRLTQKWTAGLSRWLYQCLVLQDIAQLTEMYTEAVEKTILGNLANFVYIRTGSEETNEFVSKQLGKRKVYSKTRSKETTSIKASEIESLEFLNLLDTAELRRLRAGESVIVRLNHEEDNDGNPIYQYPIFNTFENDTNMIKFDDFRRKDKLSWDEIPVNNQFMGLKIEEILTTLKIKKNKPQPEKNNLFPVKLAKVKQDNKQIHSKKVSFKEIEQINLFTLNEGEQQLVESELISMNTSENEIQEKIETNWKEKLVFEYYELFESVLDKPISTIFKASELQQLEQFIRKNSLKQQAITINEFVQIVRVQDQPIAELITFLVSNLDQEKQKQLISIMKNWKGVA